MALGRAGRNGWQRDPEVVILGPLASDFLSGCQRERVAVVLRPGEGGGQDDGIG